MKFNAEMTMGEILAIDPRARLVLEGFGMHCCGCPMSQAEALADACDAHGIDLDLVLEELNSLEEIEAHACDCGCCHAYCDCEEDEEDDCDCCDDYDDDCDCGCCDDDCCCEDECDDDCHCGCK